MSKHTGPVNSVTTDHLREVIASSQTMKEVLETLGAPSNTGGGYRTLKDRCNREGISLKELRGRSRESQGERLRSAQGKRKIPLSEILVAGSTYSTGHLKKRLIKDGLLENCCSECRGEAEWQGKDLVLTLDHINGSNRDHRLENLRLLCPNCNSQTSTFSGRNKPKPPSRQCQICGSPAPYSRSGLCRSCVSKKQASRTRIKSPSKSDIKSDLETMSHRAMGRKYEVSDTTIRKWAKGYGLID